MLAYAHLFSASLNKVPRLAAAIRAVNPPAVNRINLTVCRANTFSTWESVAPGKILPHKNKSEKHFRLYTTTIPSKIVSASASSGTLTVATSSGVKSDYPSVWLRENCQCPKCYDSSSMSRSFLMHDLDTSVGILDVSVTAFDEVTINWSDGHQSTYSADWLQERAFTEEAQQKYRDKYSLPKKYWSRGHEVAQFEYRLLMADDSALLEWLCTLEIYGAALVRGTPGKLSATQDLCQRTARVQYTHYGYSSHVHSKDEGSNLSYTSKALDLHNDMPTYQNMPGIVCLHMMKTHHGPGGSTVISDGFMAARQMRRLHPHQFGLLTTTDIYQSDRGETDPGMRIKGFHKITKAPIIMLDNRGTINKIRFQTHSRDSHLDMPTDDVLAFYKALRVYFDLINEHSITYKMQDGDMTVLDNFRCQHGRTAYCGATSGRHLINTYMSWDEAACRRRRLQEQLGKQ